MTEEFMKFKTNGCEICGRELTTSDRIGPECAKNYAAGIQAAGTSAERIAALEDIGDSDVSKWVRVAKQAIGQGKIKFAQTCFERADRRAALVGASLPPMVAPWCETHWSSDCAHAAQLAA
jgi:hypothetical protein